MFVVCSSESRSINLSWSNNTPASSIPPTSQGLQEGGGDALEGEGPQRRPQKQLGRRLEEVAEAVGGGYCRLQMPLRLALGVRGSCWA